MTTEVERAIEENHKYYTELNEKLERKMKHTAWCEGRDAAAAALKNVSYRERYYGAVSDIDAICALKSPYEGKK